MSTDNPSSTEAIIRDQLAQKRHWQHRLPALFLFHDDLGQNVV